MTTKKCPFIKLLLLCFPMLNKKPTKEQNEIIDLVNEGIDQIQDVLEELKENEENAKENEENAKENEVIEPKQQ